MRLPWTLWRHLAWTTLVPFALLFLSLSTALLLLLSLRVGELVPAGAVRMSEGT